MEGSDSDVAEEVDVKDLPLAARLELMSRGHKGGSRGGPSGEILQQSHPCIGVFVLFMSYFLTIVSTVGHKRKRTSVGHEEGTPLDNTDMAEKPAGVKKKRKGAPKEMPSNKPVSRMRTVVEASHKPRSRGNDAILHYISVLDVIVRPKTYGIPASCQST